MVTRARRHANWVSPERVYNDYWMATARSLTDYADSIREEYRREGLMAHLNDPLRKARSAVGAGEFRSAWDSLQEANVTARASGEWQLLAAMAVWRLGQFEESRSAAQGARDVYRAACDMDGEMRSENVAAAGAFALGDLSDAEQGFYRARRLSEEVGDRLLGARCANNLGNVHYYRGNHVAALNAYSLAVAEFEKERFNRGLGEAWHNMGIVLRDLNQLASARSATERALDIARKIDDQRLRAQATSSHAETLALMGEGPLARAMVNRALNWATELEDKLTQVDALRVLSIVEWKSGDLDAALEDAHQSREVAESVSHGWMVATANQHLAILFSAKQDDKRARDLFLLAAEGFDEIGSTANADRMRREAESLEGQD
jgi:tetratricopeptide (TPR) repeat protein